MNFFKIPFSQLIILLLNGIGAMLTAASVSNFEQITVQYDAAGRLIRTSGFAETEYAYDAAGLLAKETVHYGNEASGFTTIVSHLIVDELAQYPRVVGEERFTYQHALAEKELLPEQIIERRTIMYACGPLGLSSQKVIHYAGEQFGQIASEELSFPQVDHQGSIIALINNDGELTLRREYDAYGNIRYQEGNGWTTLGYNGERMGTADGLLWVRARHYNPKLRRWMQRDDFPGHAHRPLSRNRYAYVEGDPVNNIDPSGNLAIVPPFMAGAFIGGSALGTWGAIEGINSQIEINRVMQVEAYGPQVQNREEFKAVGDLRSAYYSSDSNARIHAAQKRLIHAEASVQLADVLTTFADSPAILAPRQYNPTTTRIPGQIVHVGAPRIPQKAPPHATRSGRSYGFYSLPVPALFRYLLQGYIHNPEVLSGHGSLEVYSQLSTGTSFTDITIIPEGTTFTVWAEHGKPITFKLGNYI